MDNKERVKKLFEHTRNLWELKFPLVKNIQSQEWHVFLKDIPMDTDLVLFGDYLNIGNRSSVENSFLMKIKKPIFEECPTPDDDIIEWIEDGWDDPKNEAQHKNHLKKEGMDFLEEKFEDIPLRVEKYSAWVKKRREWTERQMQSIQTGALFENLYEIYMKLDENPDDFELMCGNGMILDKDDGTINHPIILKSVRLAFDSQKNEICIFDSDTETELYDSILRVMEDINYNNLKVVEEELIDQSYHPFDIARISDYLRSLANELSFKATFLEESEIVDIQHRIFIKDQKSFFLRKKVHGLVRAVEEISQFIDEEDITSPYIRSLVDPYLNTRSFVQSDCAVEFSSLEGESKDILLAKASNQEQIEIAQKIEAYDAVLVQGPPGTGKTHTIANLLGHFLAQGKRVLVTSHTRKALGVLKEKLPDKIQDLCVSLIDESNKDMIRSVDKINEYAVKTNSEKLAKQSKETENKRNRILADLTDVREKIFAIKNMEYESIVYDGKGYSVKEVADFLLENKTLLGYIEDMIEFGQPFPISSDEVDVLYKFFIEASLEEEAELQCILPDPKSLPTPKQLGVLFKEKEIAQKVLQDIKKDSMMSVSLDYLKGQDLNRGNGTTEGIFQPLIEEIRQYKMKMDSFEQWMIYAASTGGQNGVSKAKWLYLEKSIKEYLQMLEQVEPLILSKDIFWDDLLESDNRKSIVKEMAQKFSDKGKLSILDHLFNKELTSVFKKLKVNGKELSSEEDARMILKMLEFQDKESLLESLWDELIALNGGTAFRKIKGSTQGFWRSILTKLQMGLMWYTEDYPKLGRLIINLGLDPILFYETNSEDSMAEKTIKIFDSVNKKLPHYSEMLESLDKIIQVKSIKDMAIERLAEAKQRGSKICEHLIYSLSEENIENYSFQFDALDNLYKKNDQFEQREKVVQKLKEAAPKLAQNILGRCSVFNDASAFRTIEDAWKWRSLKERLDEVSSTPFDSLQKRAFDLSEEFREVTKELIEYRSWYHCLKRLESDGGLQKNLKAWSHTISKIGKGKGKNVAYYTKVARELMIQCQSAVPIWVMPMHKIYDSFSFVKNNFDILIVDEASQSDITALPVLFMAEKAIIVGDNKQVSPLAVGMKGDAVKSLISKIEKEVPNAHLYDLKTSLYDIFSVMYPQLMLREHFRCVPEIIQYCNEKFYDNKIKPLRESGSTKIKPALVSYRTNGRREENRKINKTEADHIIALVKACIEQPEYKGKTFGVISLLGTEQSEYIQNLIFSQIDASKIVEHQIICGVASALQGDERDIVFLSMVDSGKEKQLYTSSRLETEQRYNVAVSRAKDQLWVVHSLDYQNDLKPGDIRRSLLEYVDEYQGKEEFLRCNEIKFDSDFEKQVALKLDQRGYNIIPQWKVGSYRIDMVAEYRGKRIAIECDGVKYHSGDKIIEDMRRQAILERLGWRFIRIRGSEFYKDPKSTIERVCGELERFEIFPENKMELNENVSEERLLHSIKNRVLEILKGSETASRTGKKYSEKDQIKKEIIRNNVLRQGEKNFKKKPQNSKKEKDDRIDKKDIKNIESKQKLLYALEQERIEYVLGKGNSNTTWVILPEDKKEIIEALVSEGDFSYRFDKRGADATNNRPAWHIRENKNKEK